MSGGLAFEGLNNVSSTPNDMLIILNDNDMSIDRAVGGMEKYLLNLDTNETYNRLRFKASQWLHSKGYLNEDRKKGILRLNNALKSALSHQQNIFEGMNIRYFGPFDGHDVKEVARVLKQLKNMKVLSCCTCIPPRERVTNLPRRVLPSGTRQANSIRKRVRESLPIPVTSLLNIRMFSVRRCWNWL